MELKLVPLHYNLLRTDGGGKTNSSSMQSIEFLAPKSYFVKREKDKPISVDNLDRLAGIILNTDPYKGIFDYELEYIYDCLTDNTKRKVTYRKDEILSEFFKFIDILENMDNYMILVNSYMYSMIDSHLAPQYIRNASHISRESKQYRYKNKSITINFVPFERIPNSQVEILIVNIKNSGYFAEKRDKSGSALIDIEVQNQENQNGIEEKPYVKIKLDRQLSYLSDSTGKCSSNFAILSSQRQEVQSAVPISLQ